MDCHPSAAQVAREHELLSLPRPRLRIAHCIVGLAATQHDKRRGVGVADSKGYKQFSAWSNELASQHNITSSVFLHVELRNETIKARRTIGLRDKAGAGFVRMSNPSFAPLAHPACDLDAPAHPASVLDGAIRALRPASVVTTPLDCFCKTHATCACPELRDGTTAGSIGKAPSAAGLPMWWEQLQRTWACYRDVARYERRLGWQYDFISKVRTDFDWHRNGVTPRIFTAAVHASLHPRRPRLVTSNWGLGDAYNNMDWIWIAPRALARAAFNMSEATCDWLACVQAKATSFARVQLQQHTGGKMNSTRTPLGDPLSHFLTDGILSEWWLSHRVPFEALQATRGTTHNSYCVHDSQEFGLVTPSTPRHTPTCPP